MAYTGIEPMTLELAASCSKRFLRTIQQFSVSWAWKPLPFKNIYFHFLPDSFEKQHNTQSFLVIFFPLYLRLKIFIRRWTNIYTYTHTHIHIYVCIIFDWIHLMGCCETTLMVQLMLFGPLFFLQQYCIIY